jgi:hypothetical protein
MTDAVVVQRTCALDPGDVLRQTGQTMKNGGRGKVRFCGFVTVRSKKKKMKKKKRTGLWVIAITAPCAGKN